MPAAGRRTHSLVHMSAPLAHGKAPAGVDLGAAGAEAAPPALRRSEARWRRRESNPRPKTLLDAYLRAFPIIYCRHIKRQSVVS